MRFNTFPSALFNFCSSWSILLLFSSPIILFFLHFQFHSFTFLKKSYIIKDKISSLLAVYFRTTSMFNYHTCSKVMAQKQESFIVFHSCNTSSTTGHVTKKKREKKKNIQGQLRTKSQFVVLFFQEFRLTGLKCHCSWFLFMFKKKYCEQKHRRTCTL